MNVPSNETQIVLSTRMFTTFYALICREPRTDFKRVQYIPSSASGLLCSTRRNLRRSRSLPWITVECLEAGVRTFAADQNRLHVQQSTNTLVRARFWIIGIGQWHGEK